jgi:hypothetical protein
LNTPSAAATRCYQENKDVAAWDEALQEILACMPLPHSSTLQHLLSFLVEVSEYSADNSMDRENLSRIFAPTLMRAAAGSGDAASSLKAGGAAGTSMETLQLDLLVAAAELNLCKVSVELLMQYRFGLELV